MLLKPVSFLKKAAGGVTWDVEDDFSTYTTGQNLAALSEYDDVNGNTNDGTFTVKADDTVEVSGTSHTARVLARVDTSISADMRAEVDVVTGAGSDRCHASVVARSDGAGKSYELLHDTSASTVLKIRKWTATNTFSDIHSYTITAPSTPFTLAIEVTTVGGNAVIEGFIDGVSVGTPYTDSSSPHLTGDHAGFGQYNEDVSSTQDNLYAIDAFRARGI